MDASPLEPTPPTSECESPGEITMATTTLSSYCAQFMYSPLSTACVHSDNPSPSLLPPLPQDHLTLLSPNGRGSTEWGPLPVQSLPSVQLKEKAGDGKGRRKRRKLQGAVPRGGGGRRVTGLVRDLASSNLCLHAYYAMPLAHLIMVYTDCARSALTG